MYIVTNISYTFLDNLLRVLSRVHYMTIKALSAYSALDLETQNSQFWYQLRFTNTKQTQVFDMVRGKEVHIFISL